MSRIGYPDTRPTSYGQGQGQRAGRQGRLMGRTVRQDTGRMVRQDTGRTGKAGQWAGWTRIVHGQDGRGIKRAGRKKLDANSSGLSPGRDTRMINGTAQSEIILSGHLDYKQAQSLDSPRMRAILSTVTACPGHQ